MLGIKKYKESVVVLDAEILKKRNASLFDKDGAVGASIVYWLKHAILFLCLAIQVLVTFLVLLSSR